MRLGICGAGRLAEVYAEAIASLPGVVLAAVADPVWDRALALARAAGADAYPGAPEMVAEGKLDAVVVCSPVGTHVEAAEQAAARGLRSLVEKPPAADAAGAARLAELRPAPRIAFNRRYLIASRVRPSVPAAGPLELRLEISYRRASWSAHEVRDEALLDLCPHLIDLARWLSGAEPRAVEAAIGPERAAIEIDLGPRGTASIRGRTDRPHRELVEVRAGGRRIASARLGGALAAVAGRLRRSAPPLLGSIREQLRDFQAVVAGAEAPRLATAADGVAAMRAIDAARASAGAGGASIAPSADRVAAR